MAQQPGPGVAEQGCVVEMNDRILSGVHMTGVRLLGEPRPNGVFGGEEALLGLGDFMEPSGSFFVRSRHASPNFLGGLCASDVGAGNRPLVTPWFYARAMPSRSETSWAI